VYARVGNDHAVDEILQEVALAAAKQPNAKVTAEPGWLYRVAIRQALLFRRRQGRETKKIAAYATRRSDQDTSVGDPLSWLLAAEEAELVRSALLRLRPGDRELLLLRYGEDWTAREIAERLRVRINTVETRLHRARTRLRQALESTEDTDD
jgi:RNA polymerase sigma-70 factor (ECF subfamily)